MIKQKPVMIRERGDSAQRETQRLAWVMLSVVVGLEVVLVLAALEEGWAVVLRQGLWLIWAGFIPFALAGIVLARRGQSIWAVRLLVVGLMLVMLATELRVTGFGLIQAAALIVFTAAIVASSRLPSLPAVQLIAGSVLVGVLILVLDQYAPGTRETFPQEISIVVNVIAALVIAVVGLLALRHWSQFHIRTKLIVGFIVVSLASVFAVSVISTLVVAGSLSSQVGANLNTLAVNKANLLASGLIREQDLVLQLASSDLLRGAVVAADVNLPTDPAALDAQIRELNREWKRSRPTDPAIQNVLSNPASTQILHFRDNFPRNLQILLTDRNGLLVAATNSPDDLYLRNQEWWSRAFNMGKGGSYVSQPLYVPNLNQVGIIFAAPIHDPTTADVVGVVQAVYSMAGLTQELGLSAQGPSGSTDLVFPSGQILHPNGKVDFVNDADKRALSDLQNVSYANVIYGGRSVLASRAMVNSEFGSNATAIGALNWNLVVYELPAEALRPVGQASQAAIMTGVGALLLAGLLAWIAAQFFSSPITRLTNVAEKVAEGDLTARATVDAEDEIGALATTFNRMTGRLRQTLETLEQRVADRTAELAHAGQELERRAGNLETSAEIARAAASTLNIAELFPLVARSIGERFGFAHVGVYMLDAARNNAVLQASYSGLGQARLTPGECVPVGSKTFVGNVTAQGERRLAQDVSWDPFYPRISRLGTRSELTLPLVEAGQTVGALDVHRAQAGGFSPADVTALTGLADQISIAIQNARSFERQAALAEENRRSVGVQTALALEARRSAERAEALAEENRLAAERQAALALENRRSAERAEVLAEENRQAAERQAALARENQRLFERAQRAVEELNSLTRRLTGEGWDTYLETRTGDVLIEDAVPEMASAQPALEPLNRAGSSGEIVTATNGHSTVALPILLRGEVIGSMALEDSDPGRKWSQDEITLAEQVSERLALALDNARLYESAQQELVERKRAEEETLRRNGQLATLNELGQRLATVNDPVEIAQTVHRMLGRVMDNSNFYIAFYDDVRDMITFPVYTIDGRFHTEPSRKFGGGLTEYVIRTRNPLVVLDRVRDTITGLGMEARGREARSLVSVPLLAGEQALGVMTMQDYDRPNAYTPPDIALFSAVAGAVSSFLANARLYESLQQELVERQRAEQAVLRRNEELGALNRVTAQAARLLDVRALLAATAHEIVGLFHVRNSSIALLSADGTELEVVADASRNNLGPPMTGVMLPLLGQSAWLDVITTGRTLVVENAQSDPRMRSTLAQEDDRETRRIIIVPLQVRGQVIGTIGIAGDEPERDFTQVEVDLAETIAAQIAGALENARLFEQVQDHATQLEKSQSEIEASLREKEILLKEIHHRVKNNLQVVMSLLNLESARIKDSVAIASLKESQTRIRSMALIHEKLYQSKDFTRVDLDGYVRNLASYLFRTYKASVGAIELQVLVHDVMLSIDRAIPCGLIINELITNALKYAFPENRSGRITVELYPETSKELLLRVSDNGVGFEGDLDIENSESLGMQLVSTLTNQLGGTLNMDGRAGATFTIKFPVQDHV